MLFRALIFCLSVLVLSVAVRPQGNIPVPHKFDSFGELPADDAMAHLDKFALTLSQNINLTGYVVGYTEQHILPGRFLRQIYGYQDYLVNKRGVNPDQVKVLAGGYREKRTIELWLVSKGEPPPKLSPEMQVKPTSALKFDEVTTGVGCESEFTLDLYELHDGLKFYADVLRENPKSQAWIIIYPNRHDRLSKAAGIARRAKHLLVRDFDIVANRIVTKISNRRQACRKVEIWIAPAGVFPSMASANNSFKRSDIQRVFYHQSLLPLG